MRRTIFQSRTALLRATLAVALAFVAFAPNSALSQTIKWGDVNGDGNIGAVDAQAILTAVVGLPLPTGFTKANGDANCEGTIGAIDAQIVLSFVVGLNVSQFCVGTAIQPPGPAVATVSVTLAATSVSAGTTTQATAVLKDASGNVLTGRTVTWSSGTTAIATVDAATGGVTGIAVGASVITGTSEGKTGSATLTVTAAVTPVATVTVTLGSPAITAGSTTQASAVLKDANGIVLGGRTVAWTSGTTSVATVNGTTGVVTGVSPGTSVITATSEGKTGAATITVGVRVSFGTSSEKIKILDIGGTFTPTLTGLDKNGQPTALPPVVLSSSATSVATVDNSGKITAVAPGQTYIAATSAVSSDSTFVIVARSAGGPVLRSDLTTFVSTAGGTTTVNVILDPRSTPVGGIAVLVGFTTAIPVFGAVTFTVPSGPPKPEVTAVMNGLWRITAVSANPLGGPVSLIRLSLSTPTAGLSGYLTLTLTELVAADGTDLMPISTSTRIPIIVQ